MASHGGGDVEQARAATVRPRAPRLARVRWRPRRKRFMLITGAAGFLGRHLVMATEADEWELFAPPISMIDVRQRERVIDEICTWNPRPSCTCDPSRRSPHDRRRQPQRRRRGDRVRRPLVHVSSDADLPRAAAAVPREGHAVPDHDVRTDEAGGRDERSPPSAESAVIVRTSLLYGTTWPATIQTDVEQAILGDDPR